MSQVSEVVEFKSRWGFHPCSYADYLLFKEFHKLALRDLRRTLRWRRWHAKQPQNRKWGEPAKPHGTTRDAYRAILLEYRNIKSPQPWAVAVVPIGLEYDWKEALRIFRTIYEPAAS